jgi:20S proteasome alpha/beta subunit
MTLEEAERLAIRTLKQVMEDKISESNIEIALADTSTGEFRSYTIADVKNILENYKDEAVQL